MLSRLMEEYSKELEAEQPLSADNDGTYTVPLDDAVVISITELNAKIKLTCQVAEVPTIKRQEFMEEALLGNLFGQGATDAIIGISEEGKMLTLTRVIDHEISYKEFSDVLEDFINSIDFWRDEALNFK